MGASRRPFPFRTDPRLPVCADIWRCSSCLDPLQVGRQSIRGEELVNVRHTHIFSTKILQIQPLRRCSSMPTIICTMSTACSASCHRRTVMEEVAISSSILLCVIDGLAREIWPTRFKMKDQEQRFKTLIAARLPWGALQGKGKWLQKGVAADRQLISPVSQSARARACVLIKPVLWIRWLC